MADFFSSLSWTPSWWDVLLVVSYFFVILSVPSVLIEREGLPYAALSWILALFAMPLAGLFFWWAFGRKHLERKRRRRRRASAHVWKSLHVVRTDVRSESPSNFVGALPLKLPKEDASWVFPSTADNHIRLLNDGAEFFPAMEAAIREARDHVHMLFYIWHDDATGRRFRDLLVEKAKAGVAVRVLCDAYGAPAIGGKMMDPLRNAGGKVALFLPPKFFTRSPAINFRNHRKILIADGQVGFVGGINIGDEYTANWRDLGVAIRGPAVDQLQEVFVDDWYFAAKEDITNKRYFGRWRDDHEGRAANRAAVAVNEENAATSHSEVAALAELSDEAMPGDATCAVVASGPHTMNNSLHDALFISLTRARERIYITTPYFIPDGSILTALRTAVYLGVDVRILLPAKTDAPIVRLAARSYYTTLLRAGVRLYEYQPSILHSKSLVIDDDISVVGSANIDLRSFKLNFEATCFIQSLSLTKALASAFHRDLKSSREITLKEMQARTRGAKLTDAAAHLFSPML
jgi:cardiolipin synthase